MASPPSTLSYEGQIAEFWIELSPYCSACINKAVKLDKEFLSQHYFRTDYQTMCGDLKAPHH